jgi:hypothetical protein
MSEDQRNGERERETGGEGGEALVERKREGGRSWEGRGE